MRAAATVKSSTQPQEPVYQYNKQTPVGPGTYVIQGPTSGDTLTVEVSQDAYRYRFVADNRAGSGGWVPWMLGNVCVYTGATMGGQDPMYSNTGGATGSGWDSQDARPFDQGLSSWYPIPHPQDEKQFCGYAYGYTDSHYIGFTLYGGYAGIAGPGQAESAGGNPAEECAQACAADPVNVVTGDFFDNAVDLSLAGRGFPLQMGRTYSATTATSNVTGAGSNANSVARAGTGIGWSTPWGSRLVIDPTAVSLSTPVCNPGPGTSCPKADPPSTLSDASLVNVVQETGAVVPFDQDASGTLTAPSRAQASLVRNSDGTYTFTRRRQTVMTFTAAGALTTVADANGNTTTLTRDSVGRVSTAQNASGRSLTFAYTDSSTGAPLASVTDSTGRKVTYAYNTAGDLISVTDAAGRVSTYGYDSTHRLVTMTTPGGKTTTNAYDGTNRVTQQTETVTTATSTTAATQRVTTFAYSSTSVSDGSTTVTTAASANASGTSAASVIRYDYARSVLSAKTIAPDTAAAATWRYAYTPRLRVGSVTDPLGNITSSAEDVNGNITSTTDAAGRTTTYRYDEANNLTEARDNSGWPQYWTYDAHRNPLTVGDASGTQQTITYNGDGTIASSTDARGGKTTFAYTSAGDLASRTAPSGAVTTFGYDSAGRATSATSPTGRVTSLAFTAVDQVSKVTAADGGITTFTYTPDGALASTTDPLNRVTSATYALTGEQLSATDALGKTTSYGYDAAGRATKATDATGKVSTAAYDAAGHLISTTDPLNRTTTFGYDAAGQRTSITLPSGTTTATAYNPDGTIASSTDPLGKTTTYGYDTLGRAASVTDPLGRTSQQFYSQRGQLIGTQATDGTTQSWTYDAAGNQLTWTDAAGKVTTYTYDAAGRRVSATVPGAGTTTYTWNGENELATVASAAGSGATYSYDKNGRTTKVDYTGTTPDVTFAYDKAGQRTSMVDGTGTTSYTYDKNGQPLTITAPAGKTTYTWTALGQQATLTYPDLRKVTNTYDAAGQLTKVSVPTGAAAGTSAPTGTTAVAAFGYTADGYLTSATAGNVSGSTTTMVAGDFTTFDAAEQITALSMSPTTAAGAKTGTALTGYGYTYDAAGQLTAQTVTGGLDTARSYTFDARGQLTGLTNTATTTGAGTATASQAGAFTANTAGDLTALPDGTALAYATSNTRPATASGLLTTRTPRAGPVTSYAYDANGNRTNATTAAVTATDGTITTPARAVSYGYDAADHLTKVTTGTTASAVQIGYSLNGDGQRVTRTRQPLTNGQASGTATSEKYVWDSTASVSTSGVPALLADGTFDYVYGPVATGTTTPIAQINRSTGAITWLHHDLTGSVTTLTSNTGTVTGRAAYSPYGTLEASTGTVARFGYAGEYTDPDTGLVHLRARDYDPATAQFTTLDPAAFSTGQPYAYAAGNPLQNTDPLGLFSIRQAYNAALTSSAADWAAARFTTGATGTATTALIGLGDGASFGLSEAVRSLDPGASCFVDSGSFAYAAGYWSGFAASSAVSSGAGVAGARGIQTASRLRSAEIGYRSIPRNVSVEELSAAGRAGSKNNATAAGRALQKHGDRKGSVYPKSQGSAAERNQQGQDVLDEILQGATGYEYKPGRVDIFDATGRGVRFDQNGRFITFLEPK